jgi:hypothetical protein
MNKLEEYLDNPAIHLTLFILSLVLFFGYKPNNSDIHRPQYNDHSGFPLVVDNDFLDDEGIISMGNEMYVVSADWVLSMESLLYQFSNDFDQCIAARQEKEFHNKLLRSRIQECQDACSCYDFVELEKTED